MRDDDAATTAAVACLLWTCTMMLICASVAVSLPLTVQTALEIELFVYAL
jgi:hypothetical protein